MDRLKSQRQISNAYYFVYPKIYCKVSTVRREKKKLRARKKKRNNVIVKSDYCN